LQRFYVHEASEHIKAKGLLVPAIIKTHQRESVEQER
jgi:hypothetical protein